MNIQNQWQLKKSKYLNDINKLLNDSRLRNLAKRGVKVYFMPHPMFRKYINCFKIPSYVEFPTDMSFQDILVRSDVLITDFSSNGFEMAMMNKPVLVYIPGKNEVLTSNKHYRIN